MGSEGWSELPTAKADRPNLARRDPVNHDGAGIHVGGALLAFSESSVSLCAFGLREACRSLSGLKAHDGLVVIDGHGDCISCCPCRIVSRRYFDME
jgi:hypothetical protein